VDWLVWTMHSLDKEKVEEVRGCKDGDVGQVAISNRAARTGP
jgi:hypothetical protein